MTDLKVELADVLRGRIRRGLRGGALRRGDRLPSARELGEEFDADHRVVLAAYRILADEGLVELRQRGGIYIAAGDAAGEVPLPSAAWLAEVLSQGVLREIPVTDLHEWLRGSVETLRLRVVAIQSTADQIAGLCQELRSDYGVEAVGMEAAALGGAGPLPPEVRSADLLVTTRGLEPVVTPVAERLGKPMIAVSVRPDLIGGEWRLLLRRPLYVVVQDERFVPTMLDFFADTPGVENLRPLVVGRDDLGSIPEGAPVYVTRGARALVGEAEISGRILPPVRLFSPDSSRALVSFIVAANLEALAARRQPGSLSGVAGAWSGLRR